jgi:hypothetical protein
MFPNFSRQTIQITLLFIVLNIALSGCSSQSGQVSQLRITNNGAYTINNLTVLFPEDRITFGDVSAGTTTEYKDAPKGVFHYAAYVFKINGEIVTQPVIDWIGEKPISGKLFTYTIDFDPNRTNTGDRVRLINIKIDD